MSTTGSTAPKAAAEATAATEPTGAACSANPATSGRGCCGSAATAPPPCSAAARAAPRDRPGHPRRLRAGPVHPQDRRGPSATARVPDPARDRQPHRQDIGRRRRRFPPPPPHRPLAGCPPEGCRMPAQRPRQPPCPLPISHTQRVQAGADNKRHRTAVAGGHRRFVKMMAPCPVPVPLCRTT